MVCVINYIVADSAVEDSMNEGANSLIKTKLRDIQKKEGEAIPNTAHLPKEKRYAPKYIEPTSEGYPGLMPPIG